jgi:AraC-like DNA-binding protein
LLSGDGQQEVVAEKLGISVRNLQRRLKEVGTSYQAILDDCREALALRLIENEALALYEVAYKVGFNEPSAFYKAFKRWTGKRPGDYRQDAIATSSASEVLSVGE